MGVYSQNWRGELLGIALQMLLPMLVAAVLCWIILWQRSRDTALPPTHDIPTSVFVGIGSYPLFLFGQILWNDFPHWSWGKLLSIFFMLLVGAAALAIAVVAWWAREGLLRHGRRMPGWVVAAIFIAAVAAQYGWWHALFHGMS